MQLPSRTSAHCGQRVCPIVGYAQYAQKVCPIVGYAQKVCLIVGKADARQSTAATLRRSVPLSGIQKVCPIVWNCLGWGGKSWVGGVSDGRVGA